jgi:hypothetical protein
MTHDELCERAARWLRGPKPKPPGCWASRICKLVLREVVSTAGEIPDAIGWWGSGQSILVECKASRADYLRDAHKCHRARTNNMGAQRYYMTPPGLLLLSEIADGWGLLEVHGRSIKVVKEAAFRDLDPGGYRLELLHMLRGIRMVNGEDRYPVKKSAAYAGEEA